MFEEEEENEEENEEEDEQYWARKSSKGYYVPPEKLPKTQHAPKKMSKNITCSYCSSKYSKQLTKCPNCGGNNGRN